MTEGSGVVLFGGTFNPIHHGHLIVARAVVEHLNCSRMILIPSAQPPHKLNHVLADAADRLEMARLAVADEPMLEVSDVEICRTGPSYTILTVQHFREQLGTSEPLYWLIGGDSLPELYSWYRIDELVELCTIVTAVRPGYEMPDLDWLRARLAPAQVQRLLDRILLTPRIDISATTIRERIRNHRSIRYLIPESVAAYINQNGLYE